MHCLEKEKQQAQEGRFTELTMALRRFQNPEGITDV